MSVTVALTRKALEFFAIKILVVVPQVSKMIQNKKSKKIWINKFWKEAEEDAGLQNDAIFDDIIRHINWKHRKETGM